MGRKAVSRIVVRVLLIVVVMLAFNIQQTEATEPPATEWNRTYGGASWDQSLSMVQTVDGGYALAGTTNSFGAGQWDFWLVKTDADGHMEWNKTYGGTGYDEAYSLIQTSDGGYALAGYTRSFGAGSEDVWLVKTDVNGNMEWNETYGGTSRDFALIVVQTFDGGYALAGHTMSFGAGVEDLWLVKTDSTGNMEWNKTYGGTDSDVAFSVVETSDGGYVTAGWTKSFGAGDYDAWLVKTDADGNMEWNRTYGGASWDESFSVVQTVDGGYALAGGTNSSGAVGFDVWLVKTDSAGNMEWNKTYGGVNDEWAWPLVQTVDGGYVLAGATNSSGAGDWDAWLVKTDSAGNMEWNKTYGGADRDETVSVVETWDGGYALAGFTMSFGVGDFDFWLIKLAPLKISATVDIDPDTLNLKSNGQWIAAYITLPKGHDVEDIVLETVYLDGIAAAWLEIQNGVCMVNFERAAIQGSMTSESDYDSAPKFYDLALTVTGELADGTLFEGSDTIKVLQK